MNKIIIINNCNDCPFFDNEYYEYNENCTKTGKQVKSLSFNNYPIPADCPLPTTNDDITE